MVSFFLLRPDQNWLTNFFISTLINKNLINKKKTDIQTDRQTKQCEANPVELT